MPIKETRYGLSESLTVWIPYHVSQRLKLCAQSAQVTITEIVVRGLEWALDTKEYSTEYATERWIEENKRLRDLEAQSKQIAKRILYTKLVNHIRDNCRGEATVRDIALRHIKGLTSSAEIKAAFQDLAEQGFGRVTTTRSRNGLHSIKFTLAPGYQDVVQYSVSGTGTETLTKGDVKDAESSSSGQAGSETSGVSAEGV
ncbi:MAG: hypothetical protein LC131_07570 [Anaerolineae bacterium]|nr:hypothetical protein [Anaerolineae bacterium]